MFTTRRNTQQMLSYTPEKPEISVIIVNYNAGDRLLKCLNCLAVQAGVVFEVIIVDNASTDGGVDRAQIKFPYVQIVKNEENIGFAAANNQAALLARGEWLAFLNPDAYPDIKWLSALKAATQKYPEVHAFGSTQISANDPDRIDGAGDALHILGIAYRSGCGKKIETLPQKDIPVFSPCAAAALYRRDVFENLGGFDEDFFCYQEDVDLGFRLRLMGGQVVQLAAAIVHHEGSAVTGRYSDFTIYHGNRNRVWLCHKNIPAPFYGLFLPFQFIFNGVYLFKVLLTGGGAPYLRALYDGYRALPRLTGKRKCVQNRLAVSPWHVVRAMTWSPLKLLRRR